MHRYITPISSPHPIELLGRATRFNTAHHDALRHEALQQGVLHSHLPALRSPPPPPVDVCSKLYSLCLEWQPRLDAQNCDCLFNVNGGHLNAETFEVVSWCVDEIIGGLIQAWADIAGRKTMLIQLDRKADIWTLVITAKYGARIAPDKLDCETVARMAASIGAQLHVRFFSNGVAFAITAAG